MRILAAISHYFKPDNDVKYGSLHAPPDARAGALRTAIMALHQAAGSSEGMLFPPENKVINTNDNTRHQVDVIVCTTGDAHLLGQLNLPATFYKHNATSAEPMLLGFECHDVLRQGLGRYDCFCYLEDDLVIQDPWFFIKWVWFNGWAGANRILQPNRFEMSTKAAVRKVYIDGDISPKHTADHQKLEMMPDLMSRAMTLALRFRPSSNPHAGCFFLTAAQMEQWSKKDYFLDRDTGFMGPLESAATLGVLRTFELYKAAPECADFFEILHADNRYQDKRLHIDNQRGYKIIVPKGG